MGHRFGPIIRGTFGTNTAALIRGAYRRAAEIKRGAGHGQPSKSATRAHFGLPRRQRAAQAQGCLGLRRALPRARRHEPKVNHDA